MPNCTLLDLSDVFETVDYKTLIDLVLIPKKAIYWYLLTIQIFSVISKNKNKWMSLVQYSSGWLVTD